MFLKYEEEAINYYGKEYFDALIQQVKGVASPEMEKVISEKMKEKYL